MNAGCLIEAVMAPSDALPRALAGPALGEPLRAILDGGRWAPSGDNVQPWRFHVLDGERVDVTLHGDDSFYETLWNAKGIFLAAGGLLETLRIVASQHGRRLDWQLAPGTGNKRIRLRFTSDVAVASDPLQHVVAARSVQRHAYRLTPLTPAQRERLERSVGTGFELAWNETPGSRWQAARLNMKAADIRFRLPQTFETNQHILDWDQNFSPDRIPVKAIAVDALTRRLMKLLLKRWRWLDFMNRYLGATLLPSIEMDLVPGLACAAHFVLRFSADAADTTSPQATIRAGQAMQRLWLQATAEGLALQPSMAPALMAGYHRHPDAQPRFMAASRHVAESLADYARAPPHRIAFMGRIGTPRSSHVKARSVRKSLDELASKPDRPA